MTRSHGETHAGAAAFRYGSMVLSVILGCLLSTAAFTQTDPAAARPAIALIIDDLGHGRRLGVRAVTLQGPVAVAILPHTRHSMLLAELAHLRAKEVLLHLPLQPEDMEWQPDPGGIGVRSGEDELLHILRKDLEAMPHVSGVNNHMGSLFTRLPDHMSWIMQELSRQTGLFFVDSYTHADSVALEIAARYEVPAIKRDVFLDDDPSPEAVTLQFSRLKRRARRHGHAVGIGHPRGATLQVLEREIPKLAGDGYELISVMQMIRRQHARQVMRQAALHGTPELPPSN